MLTWAGLLAIACLLISGLLSVLHLALLDLSRNRSRRFCSTTCGNREAQAAFRARRAGVDLSAGA